MGKRASLARKLTCQTPARGLALKGHRTVAQAVSQATNERPSLPPSDSAGS